MKKRYIKALVALKKVDKDEATIDGVFSTNDVDRHGDIVHQKFNLKEFKANPVVLNSHNYRDATEVIGKVTKISVKEGKLQGQVKFAVDENPKAKTIFDLYAGGFLNAFSIGFIPEEFNEKGEITKSSLLELSTVAVPANAYATAKSVGIDVDALDDDDVLIAKGEGDDVDDDGGIDEEIDLTQEKEDEGDDEGDDEPVEPAEEKDEPQPEPKKAAKRSRRQVSATERRERLLKHITKAIDAYGELKKVDTRLGDAVTADERKAINRIVRKAMKAKR